MAGIQAGLPLKKADQPEAQSENPEVKPLNIFQEMKKKKNELKKVESAEKNVLFKTLNIVKPNVNQPTNQKDAEKRKEIQEKTEKLEKYMLENPNDLVTRVKLLRLKQNPDGSPSKSESESDSDDWD